MSKIAVEKSQIQCTLGLKPTRLVVTSQTFIKISDALIATEEDKQSMVNIPSFGNCKCNWFQPPCVPNPQKWINSTSKDSINGMKKLTIDSYCMCVKGGKITFLDTGINDHVNDG